MIVQKKEVPRPKEEEVEQEYKREEGTGSGSNIISDYLKEQMKRADEQEANSETESVADVEQSDKAQVIPSDASVSDDNDKH